MENIKVEDIREKLNNNFDVIYREVASESGTIYIIYIGDLCDSKYISEYIVTPLMKNQESCNDIDTLKKKVIASSSAYDVTCLDDAILRILTANVVIVFSNLNKALYCEAKGYPTRSIDVPITETVIKGPREGFTESLSTNITSIRRRIKTPNLKIEQLILGAQSQTSTAMLYLDDIAPKELVDYIRDRINILNKENNKDFVLYSDYIEERLRCKGTPFDTIGYTEKPDIAASKLCEGRVIVIVDGSPFIVTAPYFFLENFQASDDYTMNKFMANSARILRWFAFIMSTLVPGLYLALVTYHFRLIPSTFIFRMAIFRSGVPVPTVVELLYMIFFFQIIREAGVRLPQPIGPTLSIVGALILGDAAVRSGLASQVTVVVVAITSITSYLLPKMYAAVFMWNIIMIIFSGFLGLPGFFMGFVVFVSHIAGLTTCEYPYLYPLGTLKKFNYKDIIFRGDLTKISSSLFMKDDNK